MQMVEKHFAEPDRAPALEILTSYAERFAWLKDLERVRIDMVLVAKGDLDKLTRQAEMDWRDIIMAAEYELRDGKLVKRASLD
jgi:hypothetical protein